MPKHDFANDKQLFKRLTEPVRRGRRRVKEEFVPELAAWLVTMSLQYENIVDQSRHIATKPTDQALKDNTLYARHALAVIQTLINGLSDGMDGNNWRDAVRKIREYIGVEAGDPIKEIFDEINNRPINLNAEE